MIIREATIQDANRLSYLIRTNTLKVEENKHSTIQKAAWNAQNTPRAIRASFHTRKIFCAIQHNRLVGTIALEGKLLCGMYVSYAKRGQGIGQLLINHLEDYARKQGIKELVLTATANGHGFYLRNGYVEYGEIVHDYDGVEFPEVKMRKQLIKK